MDISILFQIISHDRLLEDSEYSSPCCAMESEKGQEWRNLQEVLGSEKSKLQKSVPAVLHAFFFLRKYTCVCWNETWLWNEILEGVRRGCPVEGTTGLGRVKARLTFPFPASVPSKFYTVCVGQREQKLIKAKIKASGGAVPVLRGRSSNWSVKSGLQATSSLGASVSSSVKWG